MKCGLLGEVLGHSYSPQIHSYLGTYSYCLFEKKPEELEAFLSHGDFHGLNVTIPYKKAVIPYCSELTDRAKALGAVNTLIRREDGTRLGHNTDYFGFAYMVKQSGLDVAGKKVLVLGSGGASKPVVAVLSALGANPVVISRTGENHYGNLHLHEDASVLVNCTPVGMYPNVLKSPVSLDAFPHLEGVLDLIYNPERTQLLMEANQRGLVTCNGLSMLVAQAFESAQWFLGKSLPETQIKTIYRNLKKQTENIILIGMPGCGKSTVGKILSAKTGKTFIDTDGEIEKKAGMSIPDIFAREGESGFRARETAVLQEYGKQSGLVIATGGGWVTKAENYPHLHQNGRIFWLQRPVSQLERAGRPLSIGADLEAMYEKRAPLYRQFSDETVYNCNAPEETAQIILKLWEESL